MNFLRVFVSSMKRLLIVKLHHQSCVVEMWESVLWISTFPHAEFAADRHIVMSARLGGLSQSSIRVVVPRGQSRRSL